MLELRDLHKHYESPGELVKAVDGVDLKVSEGEFLALFGPSGSGKTTLLSLIGALKRPDSGQVLFRGRDLESMTNGELAHYRRKEIGFVFQDYALLNSMTAVSNVALRLLLLDYGYHEADKEALSILDRVEMGHRARQYAFRLSGGEKQRVAIARALAVAPSLIIADEPTGNLDVMRGRQMLEMLSDLARERGTAVILATHDLRAVSYASRVYEIRDGLLYDFDRARAEALAAT